MGFKFIHTADWQLGRPFRAFDARVANLLEQARLDAIGRIGAIARNQGAAHVLVAGDVFDSQQPSPRTITQVLDRLAAAREVTWHLLPGNHDPARPAGLWEQLVRRGLPANARVYVESKPVEIASGVLLLPSPWTTKSQTNDSTAWMDAAPTPAGALRIGLAHGSIRDFTSMGESPAIIDPARAHKARLDYLALGDWHGTEQIDPRTWYAGTPEPDRFPDNAPGNVLAVSIDGPGRASKVERVPSAHFTWAKRQVELSDVASLSSLERELLAAASQVDRLLVKLTISGSVSALVREAIERWCATFAERVCHLEADLSGLASALGASDLAALDLSDDVRRAAERLQAATQSDDPRTQQLGNAALGWLVRLAREGAQESGA